MYSNAAKPHSLYRAPTEALWIALAAAVLLVPALAYGRPFVFGDTAYYWTWGGDVLDADDSWWRVRGTDDDGALLVRPDTIVAWRCRGLSKNPEAELRAALLTCLGLHA